jgi:hypothetical protein
MPNDLLGRTCDASLGRCRPSIAEAIRLRRQSTAVTSAALVAGQLLGYGVIAYDGSRGKQTTWPVVAFSPRKTELVLYLNTEIESAAFAPLGPHRRGVGCLYVKRLTTSTTWCWTS